MGSHGTQVPVVRGFFGLNFFSSESLRCTFLVGPNKKTFELRGILSRRAQPPQGLSRHGGIHGLENGWKSPFPSIKKRLFRVPGRNFCSENPEGPQTDIEANINCYTGLLGIY